MIKQELEDVVALLKQHHKPTLKKITCPLIDSLEYTLAETIYAPIYQPPFDRSPLDGIALRACDTIGITRESGKYFERIAEVCAGDYFDGVVGEGQAVRIMTGAPIPKGADCVIKQEAIAFVEGGYQVYDIMKPYMNYCKKGEDITLGQKLMDEGEVLTPVHIGILASIGINEVSVYEKLTIGVMSTGTELMMPGQALGAGQIYNSNSFLIASRLRELGAHVKFYAPQTDDVDAVVSQLDKYFDEVDVLVTTGGVSVGKKDIMHEVIQKLGAERLFWKVNMKPGTPMLGAKYKNKLLFALSGNPFAAMVNLELVVRPVVFMKACGLETKEAILENAYLKQSPQRRMIRGKYKDGKVTMNTHNDSGVLSSMKGCNCLVDVPEGTPDLANGERVKIIML